MTDPVQNVTPAKAAEIDHNVDGENYVERLPREVDIFGDELAGGPMGETMSSRFARWDRNSTGFKQKVGRFMCIVLGKIQKNHDAQAVEADRRRGADLERVEEESNIIPR